MIDNIFKTTYKDKGVEKEQWWLAEIPVEYHDMHHYHFHHSNTFTTSHAENYFKRLSDTPMRDITFSPITEPTVESEYNSRFMRGDDSDTNPFTVRGRTLQKIRVYFLLNGDLVVRSSNGKGSLTKTEFNFIKDNFYEQLREHLTEKLRLFLVNREKDKYKNRLLKQISEMHVGLLVFTDKIKNLA